MPERNITLLTSQDSLTPVNGLTGALVESAVDAPWLPANCVPSNELLGSWEQAKKRAAALVHELLAKEPEIDGVRHLYVLKELLIRAAYQHQLVMHLDEWLRSNNVERCVFRAHSPMASALKEVGEHTGSNYRVESPVPRRRGRLEAAREYVRLKGAAGFRDLPWLAAQRLSPLRARTLQRRSAGAIQPGDWWFYSTFYTFTNIGLAYERALGRRFRFMTELRGSAETPLIDSKREWDELYRFCESEDVPSDAEIRTAQQTLRDHLEHTQVEDKVGKALLLKSGEAHDLLSRLLPLTLLQTHVLTRWLDKAAPALVVVGNEAWEGSLLQLARRRGVPTIVLQHGILGDFYQLTEHSGDVIAVRGEFWREFLSEPSRKKSVVLNCDSSQSPTATAAGNDLLFVTSDYTAMPYWHGAELDDVMGAAVEAASGANARLVIRIHPRDSAEPYKNAFQRACSRLQVAPTVEFSSGPGLQEAIGNSAVALLYFSTVFLDCLKMRVPIVSPGWHHFAFKDMVQKHEVFHFANDLKDLRRLLGAGLSHELTASASYEQFLACTPAEDVRAFFEKCAAGRSAHV